MLQKDEYAMASELRTESNRKARSTWEMQAVGSHRALGAEVGTPSYYANIRDYRYGYETPFIPETFDYASLNGKRVLEVGVGNGIDAVEMMRHGARWTGIDITTNHLTLTQRYIEMEKANGCEYDMEGLIEGDLLETELPGDYDVIYSFGVLHHIAHEVDVLRRLHDLLKPGGELRIAVYARWSFFNIWMTIMWWVRDHRRHAYDDWRSHLAEGSPLGDPVVIKVRDRSEVQGMLEAAGFRVERYEKRGFVKKYLPLIGRFLRADSTVLGGISRFLGWYHCFICRRDE